jgi:hypothetical protein
MGIKSFFRSLLGMVEGEAESAPAQDRTAKIAAMDHQIEKNLKAIEENAASCPEALEAATLCLDSITVSLKRETDRLKEGGSK